MKINLEEVKRLRELDEKDEIDWLREGIELALKHLQDDRKSLAIFALKAALNEETR